MNDAELDALLASADATLDGVTPGPWMASVDDEPNGNGSVSIDAPSWGWLASVVVRMDGSEQNCADGEANLRFIAAARSLVPDMADAIRALRAERDAALAGAVDRLNANNDALADDLAEANAKLDALARWLPPTGAPRSVTFDYLENNGLPDWLAADMPLVPLCDITPDPTYAERIARAAYEVAALHAHCHSDDRPLRYGMDWNDGYIDGCRGAADAIRALPPSAAIERVEAGE